MTRFIESYHHTGIQSVAAALSEKLVAYLKDYDGELGPAERERLERFNRAVLEINHWGAVALQRGELVEDELKLESKRANLKRLEDTLDQLAPEKWS